MDPLPLKDIHLPPPVAWWPPPLGWWLGLLLAAGVVYAIVHLRLRAKRPNIRRVGLRELDMLQTDATLAPGHKAQQLSILLRRIALSAYPREQVAGLSGREWLQWLDGLLADGRFTDGPGQALNDAPYRAEPLESVQLDALFALCRDWLQRLPSRS